MLTHFRFGHTFGQDTLSVVSVLTHLCMCSNIGLKLREDEVDSLLERADFDADSHLDYYEFIVRCVSAGADLIPAHRNKVIGCVCCDA